MKSIGCVTAFCLLYACVAGAAIAQDDNHHDQVMVLQKTDPSRAAELTSSRWIDVIEREIPPIKNQTSNAMPMIMWHGVGFETLSESEIEILRSRGLCQHLQVSTSMIEPAKALQKARMPVILMEGRTDHWPYSLAKSPTHWPHEFDLTYQPSWLVDEDSPDWQGACLGQLDGWKVLYTNTRRTMQEFRDAGVKVDAVLVDYEGDPYPWSQLFEQIKHCKRCRRDLPPDVTRDKSAWRDYCWKKYVALYDQYFAKAILDVFPDCLVTNWHVVFSSESDPVRYFVRDVDLPVLRPDFFSATNPIAYGSDLAWRELWNPSVRKSQSNVDVFYREQILQQVRTDRKNREKENALSVHSIPWVARVCRIEADDKHPVPVMSRKAYRQTLGEMWSMDVHSMQVFNPMHDGYEELALWELQDAVAAYDRRLAGD